jgi:succinate dehydrogenase/fumarate reductase cytochrome b subunit
MTASFIFKLLLFLVMIAIFISLAGGLFFLARDKGKSKRTIYSLTARVTSACSCY